MRRETGQGDEILGERGRESGRMGSGMRNWEKEGVRGQNWQGDERLGERERES